MKRFPTLLLLLAMTSSAAAFTVSNDTDYMVTVNIDKDCWWFSEDYKIIPQKRDFDSMKYLEPSEYTKFIVSVNYNRNKEKTTEKWHIFDAAETNFELKKESGFVVLFVNGERVA